MLVMLTKISNIYIHFEPAISYLGIYLTDALTHKWNHVCTILLMVEVFVEAKELKQYRNLKLENCFIQCTSVNIELLCSHKNWESFFCVEMLKIHCSVNRERDKRYRRMFKVLYLWVKEVEVFCYTFAHIWTVKNLQ